MKAKLKLENVGGLRGAHTFEFERGKVSIIEGYNSGGKSSVVKGLTAILSLPHNGEMTPFFDSEAFKLGIRADAASSHEGFVNVMADYAEVNLQLEDSSNTYGVNSDGEIIELTDGGDPRFMLAGLMSGRSKIVRQLNDLDERHEPDDFKWAVSELSLASRYDEVADWLKQRKGELEDRIYEAKARCEQAEKLGSERDKLLKGRSMLESRLSRMKETYESISSTLDELDTIRSEKSRLLDAVATNKGSVSRYTSQLKSMEKKIKASQSRIDTLNDSISAVNLKAEEKEVEKSRRAIQAKVENLIEKRGEKDGVLNLFLVAQTSMQSNSKELDCPLCGDGTIKPLALAQRIDTLQTEKSDLSSKITELNRERQKLALDLMGKRDELDSMQKERDRLKIQLRNLTGQYQALDSRASGDLDRISKMENDIAKLHTEEASLLKKIGEGDKKAKAAYDKMSAEYSKVSDRLAVVTQKISETNYEIEGRQISPGLALKVYESWQARYGDLIDFTVSRAESQRRRAVEEFNSNVKGLLDKLGFTEFRTVRLNQDYRLYVERLDKKGQRYIFQHVRTLSTSEILSIALILQMALKETYIPDIPFFLLDDVMEDFDDDRKATIMNYLEEKATANDWFLVMTKLVEGAESLRVVS